MKIKNLAVGLTALAAALGFAGTAQAQFTNGGFEAPNTPNPPGYLTFTAAGQGLPGWRVTTGDVNTVNGTFINGPNLAKEGLQYLDLIGESGSGGIAKLVPTTAGHFYELSFSYSHNIFSVGSSSANYAFSNAISGNVFHNTGTNTDLDWKTITRRFIAGPGQFGTLSFTNVPNGTTGGIFLDNISFREVTTLPEPATWAMMIGGFGLIGGLARRRRRAVAFA